MIIKFPSSAPSAVVVPEADPVAEMVKCHILDDLPFVDPAPPPRPDGRGVFRNCWNDVPTNDSHADFARGRRYGEMTIAAMQTQGANYGGRKLALSITGFDLKRIIESRNSPATQCIWAL
jgi:hypothetical protein